MILQYAKVGQLSNSSRLFVSAELQHTIGWFLISLNYHPATHFLLQDVWMPSQCHYEIFVDASTSWGLGIWIPGMQLALHACLTKDSRFAGLHIFSLEMLAILSALMYCDRHLQPIRKRILIWSDSMNSVDAFHTLSSDSPDCLRILQAAVLVELRIGCSLRVLHVEGKTNPADAISRGDFSSHRRSFPHAVFRTFEPPPWPLGDIHKTLQNIHDINRNDAANI